MWSWIAKLLLGGLSSVIKPIFDFLNASVNAEAQVKIALGTAAESTLTNADQLNTQVRLKEGAWSPWVIVSIAGFLTPFAWHTWQVVLDSSRWIPCWHSVICEHAVGSWRVSVLPGMFETTEHAVIQSLFVGAAAGIGTVMMIKAIRGK